MPLAPILHAGPRAVADAATVDWRVVALGILALTGLLLLGEIRPVRGASRRLRRYFAPSARLLPALVVMFVVFPNAVPIEHVIEHDDSASVRSAEFVHASHCHVSPGTCSDMPITAGPGGMLFTDLLLPSSHLTETIMSGSRLVIVGMTQPPLTPPPRP